MGPQRRDLRVLLGAAFAVACGGQSPSADAAGMMNVATSVGVAAMGDAPPHAVTQSAAATTQSRSNVSTGPGGAGAGAAQGTTANTAVAMATAGMSAAQSSAGMSAAQSSAGTTAAQSSAGTTAAQSGASASSGNSAAAAPTGNSFADSFDSDGPLMGYTTHNASAIPDVSGKGGHYHAALLSNANDVTLHYNQSQGRLDARRLRFPFEAIARNMGVAKVDDASAAAVGGGIRFNLAGIQVHVLDLEARNSAHIVVGHSGTENFSIEGKSTVNGVSVWDNEGSDAAPGARADLRIVGDADHSISVYWQAPNPNPTQQQDNWKPYKGTGKLSGPAPEFGAEVYVGLITYAVGETGVPFVGTCDSFEGSER